MNWFGGLGLNASMHLYLDGYLNRVGQANENFARELLELFTMSQYGPSGELNYSENDIKEIARALTGWAVTQNRTTSFDPGLHDGEVKRHSSDAPERSSMTMS